MIKRALASKRNYWLLFVAIQAVGLTVPSFADLHTNPLPLLLGIILLLPGVFVGLALDMQGIVAETVAVLLNAAAWYAVRKAVHLDPDPRYPTEFQQ